MFFGEKTKKNKDSYRNQVLLDNLPGMVYRCLNDKNWTMKFVSEKCFELTGYRSDEIIENRVISYNDLILPEDRRIIWKNLQKAMADKSSFIEEYRIKTKEGKIKWVWEQGRAVKYSKNKAIILEGFISDITEKKRSEEERTRLISAIEQSRDTIVITDIEGNILYANSAFEKLTGYKRDEIRGYNTRLLKSGIHDPVFYYEMWKTILNGETWSGRMINKKKNGDLVTEDVSISPVFDLNGSIMNFVALKRDITEQLKIEDEKRALEAQYQQAQKVESIGRLAGGVAHDLNNLLTPIIGYSEILSGSFKGGDDRKKQIDQVLQAGLLAQNLVRQLLAFSRKQALDYRLVNLNKIIDDFDKLLRSTIRENIDIKIIKHPKLPAVLADKGQIEQVIMNLAVNSQDAMPDGGRLTIETDLVLLSSYYASTDQEVQPGNYVMLAVSDSGCGMDGEVQKQIFEPFFSTKGELGTGLGLATVYGIIKQHGGNIWINSIQGAGTTFKIYLPASKEAEEERLVKAGKEKVEENNNETILITEDNGPVLELAKTILSGKGYNILSADNGSDAMRIIKSYSSQIHILLTDIIMPEMNGKELFRAASEVHPEIKVLYMSGYSDNLISSDSSICFIQKPFTSEELAEKVREVLDQK